MFLSKNLRYLRKRNNLTQEELSKILHYKSYTTVNKWESGDSEPPIEKLIKLSLLYHIDIDFMIKIDLEAFDRVRVTTDNTKIQAHLDVINQMIRDMIDNKDCRLDPISKLKRMHELNHYKTALEVGMHPYDLFTLAKLARDIEAGLLMEG